MSFLGFLHGGLPLIDMSHCFNIVDNNYVSRLILRKEGNLEQKIIFELFTTQNVTQWRFQNKLWSSKNGQPEAKLWMFEVYTQCIEVESTGYTEKINYILMHEFTPILKSYDSTDVVKNSAQTILIQLGFIPFIGRTIRLRYYYCFPAITAPLTP